MGCLSKEGQHPSTGSPTYQSIKVTNANHMSVMKTSLTIFPCFLGSAFPIIRICPGLSFATKGLGHFAALYLLSLLFTRYKLSYHKTICYHLFQYLQRIPCWKTAYNFLLLLVGFDTLTYRKDYDRSPILVGHQDSFLAPLPGSEAPLVSGTW